MNAFKPLFISFLFLLFGCQQDSQNELSSVDGQSGSITRFAIHNGFMYALNQQEVQTYSLANPENPVLVHELQTDYGLETIIVYDNTIYLGSTTALYILGLDNPAQPELLSKTERIGIAENGCDPVVVKGNYAFSTVKIIVNICGSVSAQSALVVYNVADKNNPVQIGEYPLNIPNGLGYQGNYLFVCDEGADRIEIFDISNPEALVQESAYAMALTDPVDLIVNGDKIIVSAKTDFQFFDISDVSNIVPIGRIYK